MRPWSYDEHDEVVKAVGEYLVDKGAYHFYVTDPNGGKQRSSRQGDLGPISSSSVDKRQLMTQNGSASFTTDSI